MAAKSFARSTASGSTDTYSVPFGYLDKSHVIVTLDGVEKTVGVDYTWPTDATILFTGGNVAAGTVVERRRKTPTDLLVNFKPGNLSSADLNTGNLQPLYLAQEADDDGDDLAARGWYTKAFGAGGTIEKGAEGQSAKFDASGNLVPGYSQTDLSSAIAAAQGAVSDAQAAAATAGSWRNFARLWATEDEDVTVDDGISIPGYSAKHYSIKAAAFAAALAAAVNAGYNFDTKADAELANIPVVVEQVALSGYAAYDDCGGAIYRKVTTEPSHAGKFQSADGAWWELQGQDFIRSEMFGGIAAQNENGTGPGLDGQLTDMVNFANSKKSAVVHFGPGLFPLDAALPEWTYIVHITGTKGLAKKSAAPTLLYKRYTEASVWRGVLAFSDYGFIIEDINIQSNFNIDPTTGGGSAISASLTASSPAASRTFLNRVRVSMGDGANYSLYVNGQANTTPSGPSYRGTWISDCEFFGAAAAGVSLVGVHHFFVTGTFLATTGGSGDVALQISGTAAAYNDDIQWHGGIFGKVNINWLSRSVFVSPMCDNIAVDANTTDTMWVGPHNSGLLLNSAAAGEFTLVADGMVVARGGNTAAGWRKWGNGFIEQWGTGTTSAGDLAVTWPVAFPATPYTADARASSAPSANFIILAQLHSAGLTGCSIRAMNLGTGPNVGLATANVQWHSLGI